MPDTPTPPSTKENEKPASQIPDGSGATNGSDDTNEDTASSGPVK